MVLRKRGWRIVTLAAVCTTAASALPGLPLAQSFSDAPTGNLVWGGHVPPPPRPGEEPVYIPSPAYSTERGYDAPAQNAFRGPQPTPPQFLDPPPASPQMEAAPLAPAERGPGDYGRTYPVQDAPSAAPSMAPSNSAGYGAPAPLPPARDVHQASLPPLGGGQVMDDASGYAPVEPSFHEWEGITEEDRQASTPGRPIPSAPIGGGVGAPAQPSAAPARTAAPTPGASVPSYASLEQARPPQAQERSGFSWNPFRWGRGALEDKTPSGYRSLPRSEAMCRRELQRMGVQFTDISSVGNGGSCGIQNPVRVTVAAKGIAMQPAATLSCETALQTARWLDGEVRSAARWTLMKRPTAILNASSYRCSRIAGSRTISEHALGNALDIRGFRFSDGSTMDVEPKGMFSPLERRFQRQVREGGCKYFGTVLGPGYNAAHADHFHFDVKSRMRPVCK